MTALKEFIAENGLAEEMFRLAVEACPSGMIMTDRDGKVVMANTEIERQFGYTREELVGQSIDMLVPEQLRAAHARSALSQLASHHVDLIVLDIGLGKKLRSRSASATLRCDRQRDSGRHLLELRVERPL
jgi:PAS domain-containing protein